MSFISHIKYFVAASDLSSPQLALEESLKAIPSGEKIIRIVVFHSIASVQDYVRMHTTLKTALLNRHGENAPILTLVAQPPLNSKFLFEITCLGEGSGSQAEFKSIGGNRYALLSEDNYKHAIIEGIFFPDEGATINEQSGFAFSALKKILQSEGMDVDNIIRQWNYIGGIINDDGNGQRYQQFCNARSDFYAQSQWDGGYPAATGIGMQTNLVVIEAEAGSGADYCSTAIDNPLQIAAHKYSPNVLEPMNAGSSTPKFERARTLAVGSGQLTYISGTAAISGEKSQGSGNVAEQLHLTMNNIAQLAPLRELSLLRVYLADSKQLPIVAPMLESLNIPMAFIQADICRPNLILEIEGTALNQS